MMDKEQFEREADECGMMEYLDLHCDSVGIQMILDMVNGAVAAERKAIAADADWCIQNYLEHLIPERIRARK